MAVLEAELSLAILPEPSLNSQLATVLVEGEEVLNVPVTPRIT